MTVYETVSLTCNTAQEEEEEKTNQQQHKVKEIGVSAR